MVVFFIGMWLDTIKCGMRVCDMLPGKMMI